MSNTRRKYWVQFITNNLAFPLSIVIVVLMWFIAIGLLGVIGGFIGGVMALMGILASFCFVFWSTHHVGEWLHRWSYRKDIRARLVRARKRWLKLGPGALPGLFLSI